MEEKTKRITKDQKLMLIQYLEEHKEFAHDRFMNSTGEKGLVEQWEILAEKLNALGGALKDGENWKRAWTNMRSKTKQKFQDHKNAMERSGINGAQKYTLTELDERIISIMEKVSVVGQEEVSEPLRQVGVVNEIPLKEEGEDHSPSCTTGTKTSQHYRKNDFNSKKRKERNVNEDLLQIEKQLLEEKRRKNDIAQGQVEALKSLNNTLLQFLSRRQD